MADKFRFVTLTKEGKREEHEFTDRYKAYIERSQCNSKCGHNQKYKFVGPVKTIKG
jgi:hypothetical protein